MIHLAIDTGGTFTDFVLWTETGLRVYKRLSTPDDPARAVVDGVEHLIPEPGGHIIHGSTVATNALLERKGARTALLTTAGFEDVIEIGRQNRPRIYDFFVERPQPLVPAELRFGVPERMLHTGEVLMPLDHAAVERALEQIVAADAESLAICFLHAYANPAHEQAARKLAQRTGLFLSTSHEILPEFREYERFSTTVVNAYVTPVMARYLGSLRTRLPEFGVEVMQSNGGTLSVAAAQRKAVHTILSGPAGGVVGAMAVARLSGFEQVITFDMGGTSTDVCLCPGEIRRTSEAEIGGLPVRVPVIDIHTVGAGGGSLAWRDAGGALRVGPQSAGADPGPVCYGKGEQLTVTDANLFLGRLSSAHFLGGEKRLATDPVAVAMQSLAREFGLSTEEMAAGIVRVANANMARAIRVISEERGFDPRDFCLVAFGGAGPMHACELAAGLGIPTVLVPRSPGVLSALGMLFADRVKDYSQSVMQPSSALSEEVLRQRLQPLEKQARDDLAAEGVAAENVQLIPTLAMRYIGQSYEIEVPLAADFEEQFQREHERTYGYAQPQRPTEVVSLRLKAVGLTDKPSLPEQPVGDADAAKAVCGEIDLFADGWRKGAPIYDRDLLLAGNCFSGPALVVEYSSTTVVPPGWEATVDRVGNLVVERRSDGF
jgi:N-methylhydantoinase A